MQAGNPSDNNAKLIIIIVIVAIDITIILYLHQALGSTKIFDPSVVLIVSAKILFNHTVHGAHNAMLEKDTSQKRV